jgi:hypothetical protein
VLAGRAASLEARIVATPNDLQDGRTSDRSCRRPSLRSLVHTATFPRKRPFVPAVTRPRPVGVCRMTTARVSLSGCQAQTGLSAGIRPDENAGTVRCAHGNPRLVGLAQLLLI